jgi:hypothetical protein
MPRRTNATTTEKQLPSIANRGYFSDYFLGYRLDAGLDELYKRWDALERNGDPTPRTRVRSLSTAFDKYRVEAANTAPDLADNDTRLALGTLHTDDLAALADLNDAILNALGWTPTRDDTVSLTSGEKVVHVPVAHRCDTPTGLLLVALDTVFAADPATVVADKAAAPGTLLRPIRLGDKPEGRTVLEAAQLIFTADDAPTYILVCSGGSITLLDRDRWGEGVHLGANLDDAVARGDSRARGELAAIAALFSADAINPGDQAQSVLTGLVDRAANESAGVSKDLRHGIRRSVEILANAVVHDVRYRQKGAWQQIDPDDLTRQCLRYLYRVIVLLYAEARPELGILPVDDPDYQSGYSVARLRDTALVELHSDHARNATHLQRSLGVLFTLVNDGYEADATLDTDARVLTFPGLDSALFAPTACPLLDRARLTDHTLQQVLGHLCFTKEQRGRARQVVGYATLGINQLGAVYEGLMAYRGFLATEELYELDSDGDPDTGTWVIPTSRADEFADEVFVTEDGPDGQPRRVRYSEGDFVFRLAGRDRQRSASYYSPEVLTEFTVRHTLDTYWDEHPDLTADDILHLTVCEPALGSGAFLNEAVNQLAARYLKAAQDERGETIDPDRYQFELQKAKAHFALNQAYGVDLNPTAIELAEVSLWLNSMHPGLRAPRFGARLRHGNSLIGARRATYTADQAKRRPWASTAGASSVPPTDQPLKAVPLGESPGIHHFLLPGEGWGIAADAAELKGKGGKRPEPGLAQTWAEAVRNWRRAIQAAPTKGQLDRVIALARRVEAAWATAAKDTAQHLRAHERTIEVWGADLDSLPAPGIASSTAFESPEGPTARLRLLMDAWCALWMWAPANGTALPTLDRWLDACELLLGQPEGADTGALFTAHDLDDGTLDSVERFGRATVEEVLERYPWLSECQAIARAQEFFHWELEHAALFARGGFDIQVGNPPWVRLDWDEPVALAEADPWWAVTDLTRTPDATKRTRRHGLVAQEDVAASVVRDRSEVAGLSSLLSAGSREPLLHGLRTNLYAVFMTNAWRRSRAGGATGLLHPESHFLDPKAGPLRAETYRRLRRHWHFAEARKWFDGLEGQQVDFGVHVYGSVGEPKFIQAVELMEPSTVDRSLTHDSSGDVPGIQFPEGGWDLRPHAQRIVEVDRDTLAEWVRLFDPPGTPAVESRLLRPLTQREVSALGVFAALPHRLGSTTRFWSSGMNEKNQKVDGTIVWRTERATTLAECVLQGPHILNGLPFAQEPRLPCLKNSDWDPVNLEAVPDDFIPRTNYQRCVSLSAFLSRQQLWSGIPFTQKFREAHREFVDAGSVRTLQACLLPPGPSHIHKVNSNYTETDRDTVRLTGLMMSLPYDFLTKTYGVSTLGKGFADSLPLPTPNPALDAALLLRVLRLNCVTKAYEALWSDLYTSDWQIDAWAAVKGVATQLNDVNKTWTRGTALRSDLDRWAALCEIDAIVALLLGLTSEQLAQMYRTQFPVLRKYEHAMVFDARGRQLSAFHQAFGIEQARWEGEFKRSSGKRGGPRLTMWDRVQAHIDGDGDVDLGPFVPPFQPADRVASMTGAYEVFTQRFALDHGRAAS